MVAHGASREGNREEEGDRERAAKISIAGHALNQLET